MEEPTATDWAYLAGLIDGEGSLILTHRKSGSSFSADRGKYRYLRNDNQYQCHITISNTDFKMIDWVRYTFNGCVYFSRQREGNRVPQYTVAWQAASEVNRIIKGTIPYLLTKYEVAESMLHFLTIPRIEKELRQIQWQEFQNIKESERLNKKLMEVNNG
jgi:hypothetical protein